MGIEEIFGLAKKRKEAPELINRKTTSEAIHQAGDQNYLQGHLT